MPRINGQLMILSSLGQTSTVLPGGPNIVAPQTNQFIPQGIGATADLVQHKFTKQLTLSATPTVLDLTNLVDTDGNTFSFSVVRTLTIFIVDQNDAHIVLFGFASTITNAWTALVSNPGQITIKPSTAVNQGGLAVIAPNTTGYAVTGSNKLVQLDPGANTIVVNVEFTGG